LYTCGLFLIALCFGWGAAGLGSARASETPAATLAVTTKAVHVPGLGVLDSIVRDAPSDKSNEKPGGATSEPKGQELSVEDRFLNHLISSARVVVENVIAGVKRCRIVKDVLRLTKAGMSDLVMEIACGLHNLRVSCRHPFPTFDVLSLLGSG
jgi:hypothetical protein